MRGREARSSTTPPELRRSSSTPSSPGSGPPCEVVATRGLTMQILIADDDATSRLLLQAIVTKLGHECLVAEDGSSAWELLSSGGIDVLLTDWMMPGLDGPELCRRVRDEPSDSYVYIVLTTGLDHPEQVLEGHERRRRRLPDQAGRLVRRADPPGRGRAGHRLAHQAGRTPRPSSSGPTSSCWSSRSPTS